MGRANRSTPPPGRVVGNDTAAGEVAAGESVARLRAYHSRQAPRPRRRGGTWMDVDALGAFSTGLDEGTRAAVDRLVAAIGRSGIPLDRAVKWRRLTFAVDGDFHHWICGIDVTRRGVVLQFHFGGLLPDPDGRLTAGASRFLRTLAFPAADAVDADAEAIAQLVRAAVERLPFFRALWREVQAGTLDPSDRDDTRTRVVVADPPADAPDRAPGDGGVSP